MASTGNNTLINDNIGIFKRDAFIVLVKTEWNAAIVDELENGCMNILREHQARVEVPVSYTHLTLPTIA